MPLAVALPQRIFQRAPAAGALPEEPLLELVQHDQDLRRPRGVSNLPQLPEQPGRILVRCESRKPAAQAAQQALLGPLHR